MITIEVNGVNKVAEKTDQAWAAALDVLSTEQRGKWTALVGETLPTPELQKAHGAHEMAGLIPNVGRIQIGGAAVLPGGIVPPAVIPAVPPPGK